MMQLSNILIAIFLVVVIWQSHVAGAAYARDSTNRRMQAFAKIRSVFSVLLAMFVVVLAWK